MARTQNQESKSQSVQANPPSQQRSVSGGFHGDERGHYAITIMAPVEEVFSFFRDFQNLPSFMKDLKEIQILSPSKSHWVVEVKGTKAEWDAEITSERANQMIAWKSVPGSQVETSGAIWFTALSEGRGTVVSLALDYKIPGGKLAELVTFFTGDHPAELANVNLRRLKGRIETGVIATIEGQPSGRDADAKTLKH